MFKDELHAKLHAQVVRLALTARLEAGSGDTQARLLAHIAKLLQASRHLQQQQQQQQQ